MTTNQDSIVFITCAYFGFDYNQWHKPLAISIVIKVTRLFILFLSQNSHIVLLSSIIYLFQSQVWSDHREKSFPIITKQMKISYALYHYKIFCPLSKLSHLRSPTLHTLKRICITLNIYMIMQLFT